MGKTNKQMTINAYPDHGGGDITHQEFHQLENRTQNRFFRVFGDHERNHMRVDLSNTSKTKGQKIK